MNKIIHEPNVAGQSLADRVMAAKHTITRDSLAKAVFKATTDEVMGPKRKHLDYLIWCTNVPNVSIPEMARYLIERTQSHTWVVVFKALITTHDVMNYGNERFTQFLASNHTVFNLSSFNDRATNISFDMSVYIRRYAKYLNEKAHSYRQMGYDFCKIKRGKDDGFLRTIDTTKLLQALPVLQNQLDALLEFNVSAGELNNGVINVCYVALFKDMIRLFACYNDGVINLLEKFFDMDRTHCAEAVAIYKKFVARMDKVREFLLVAEAVGYDKKDIPDLAQVPDGLCEALEDHLKSMEHHKKPGTLSKPASGVTLAISKFTAAAERSAAPGAGAEGLTISDEERRRILAEEQRQLDLLKQEKQKQASSVGGVSSVTITTVPRVPSSSSVANSVSEPRVTAEPTYAAVFKSTPPPTQFTSNTNSFDDPWAAPPPPAAATLQSSPSTQVSKPPPGFTSFGDILQPSKNETSPENGKKSLSMKLASTTISSTSPWTQPQPQVMPVVPAVVPMQPAMITPVSPTYGPGPTMQYYSARPIMATVPAAIYPASTGQYWTAYNTSPYMYGYPAMPNQQQPGMMMMRPAMTGWPSPVMNPPMMSATPSRPVQQPQTVAPNDPFGPL